MIPFLTEDIYQNLVRTVDKNAPESIHLCDFPEVNESMIDPELEASMDEVLKVVVFGRAARNTANIKSRQPIANMYIKAAKTLDDYFVDILRDELNVKNVEFKEDLSAFTAYSFKPQLRTVGPKYGKHLNAIKEYLANVDGNKAMSELKADGVIKFTADDTEIALAEEDLLIDVAKMDGYVTEGDNYVTVVIDTTLTPELIEEGYVREVILLLCGILAAIMSTADSQLLVSSSAVANDLFKGVFFKKLKDKQILFIARATVFVVAIIAIVIAWNPNSSIMNLVSDAWAGLGSAFGPAILMSLYWKRMNLAGAAAGMASGGLTVIIWDYIKCCTQDGVHVTPATYTGVYSLLVGFIVSLVFIVVVSLATPKASDEIMQEFEDVKNGNINA